MKRFISLFLVLVTLLSLVSCSPKETKKAEKVALENVYLADKIPTPDGVDLYGIIMSGDRAFFNGSKEVVTTDEYGNEISDWYDCIYVANADMSEIKDLYTFKGEYSYDEETGVDTGSYLNGYNAGKDGTLWLSFMSYKSWYDRDLEEYFYEEETTLKKLNADGEFVSEIDVTSILDEREEFSGDTYSKYLGQVFEASDGRLIITVGSSYLLTLNADGSFVNVVKLPENKSPNDMALLDSDTLRITAWDWSGTEGKIEIIDYSISKNDFKTVDTLSANHSVQMADDGTIYINDYSVVSKYDLEKKEEIPLLDFINSDINSDRIAGIYPAGNDEFYTFEYDTSWEDRALLHLTPAGAGEVVEKYIITLAANTLDGQLKSMIIDYNRSSKDYRIVVKVYGWEEKDTERLDLDILSGNAPDIVCIDGTFDLTKYETKNIFTDLGQFLDTDDEVSRDTLLENILKACERNGKIYRLPVTFGVQSLVMKKSIVGDKEYITFDDVLSMMKAFEGAVFLRETDRERIMDSVLPSILEDFIDYENGKSNFSDGSFKAFLEFAKTLPPKIDFNTYYDDIDWEAYENDFKENRALAQNNYISSFNSLEWLEEQFGETIVPIGFPTSKGEPHALNFATQFAISEKSIYKNEAWSFIKMLLGKEYQTEYIWSFPVNKEVFNTKKEEVITNTKSRYEKEEMEDDDYIIDDDMVVMPRVEDSMIGLPNPRPETASDPEKLQSVLDLIESVATIASTTTRTTHHNDPVLDIITSDTAAFFDGKKSAEETAKTIESRVNLYLSENS